MFRNSGCIRVTFRGQHAHLYATHSAEELARWRFWRAPDNAYWTEIEGHHVKGPSFGEAFGVLLCRAHDEARREGARMARALSQGSMLRTLRHARGCYDYESISNRRAARKLLRATFKEAHGVAFGIARLDEPYPTRCIIIARGTDGALVSDERDIWNPHTWKVAANESIGGNQ